MILSLLNPFQQEGDTCLLIENKNSLEKTGWFEMQIRRQHLFFHVVDALFLTSDTISAVFTFLLEKKSSDG